MAGSRPRPLYIETVVRADPDLLWRRTQDPDLHQRWDLRFTRIEQLLNGPAGGPQRFRYAFRLLPGVMVGGVGISAGERRRPDGSGTSVLRFGSHHPLSPIRNGSGYWRYLPAAPGPDAGSSPGAGSGGTRFLTGYDYEPGLGRLGPLADRLIRPAMGWATAWSFDRLRLWLDHDIPPERSLRQAVGELAGRVALAGAALLAGHHGGRLTAALAGHHGGRLTAAPSWLVTAGCAAVLATALLAPPLPHTPAARRCRRQAPDRHAATAPAGLARLERP